MAYIYYDGQLNSRVCVLRLQNQIKLVQSHGSVIYYLCDLEHNSECLRACFLMCKFCIIMIPISHDC